VLAPTTKSQNEVSAQLQRVERRTHLAHVRVVAVQVARARVEEETPPAHAVDLRHPVARQPLR
jgi:hypothetical protein